MERHQDEVRCQNQNPKTFSWPEEFLLAINDKMADRACFVLIS